jgi:NitT/TauT family transport system substrate-binding protein
MTRTGICTWLAVLAMVFPVLLSGNAGTAQTPITVRVVTSPAGPQPFYAKDLGLFKKAGLDVSVSIVSNGAAVSSAIMGGTFDLGFSNITTLAMAHEKGFPFVIVAPAGLYSSKSPTSVCAVAKDSPIKTAKDLAGKTIGLTGLINTARVGLNAWLEKNGVDVSSIKYVEIPYSQMGPALSAGRIDAGVLIDPFLHEALTAGQARILANCYDAIAPTFLLSAFFSTSDFAAAHPEIIKKFVAVMAETARWANLHRRESAQILEKWTNGHVLPGTAPDVFADRLSATQVQPLIDAAAQAKAIKVPFPANDLFAPSVRGP